MDRFEAMRVFIMVANEGSFTGAAKKLDTSNQLVSKYVAQLETQLGTRLFNRTTRKIHLTEAGQHCLAHARHIVECVADMEGAMGQMKQAVQGRLYISAPTSFASLHLAPLIRDFQKQFPQVGIDLQLNDRKVDVIEEGFDLALRIGKLKSSSLVAKPIAPIRMVLCASPAYLAEHGEPAQVSDLVAGHYLNYSYMDYGQADSPLLEALRQGSKNTLFTANNGDVLVAAAVGGMGYTLQPTFIAGEALKKGRLKILLPDHELAPMALYAVYPHRKLMANKLRAFIDFMDDYFGSPPYWDTF